MTREGDPAKAVPAPHNDEYLTDPPTRRPRAHLYARAVAHAEHSPLPRRHGASPDKAGMEPPLRLTRTWPYTPLFKMQLLI